MKFIHKMKQLAYWLSIALIFTTSAGCKKFTTFTIHDQFEVTFPANSIVQVNSPIEFQTAPTQTNSEVEFENNGSRADLVEKITITELKGTITSPSNETWNFLQSIQIFLDAEGEEAALVAERDNIPENIGVELEVNSTNEDLQRFVKKSKVQLKTEIVTDEVTTRDIEVTIDITYEVEAELLRGL